MTGTADARGMVIVGAGEGGGRAAVCPRENGWQGPGAASAIGPLAAIAKDIRIVEMSIARDALPDQTLLSQADYRLESLLAA